MRRQNCLGAWNAQQKTVQRETGNRFRMPGAKLVDDCGNRIVRAYEPKAKQVEKAKLFFDRTATDGFFLSRRRHDGSYL